MDDETRKQIYDLNYAQAKTVAAIDRLEREVGSMRRMVADHDTAVRELRIAQREHEVNVEGEFMCLQDMIDRIKERTTPAVTPPKFEVGQKVWWDGTSVGYTETHQSPEMAGKYEITKTSLLGGGYFVESVDGKGEAWTTAEHLKPLPIKPAWEPKVGELVWFEDPAITGAIVKIIPISESDFSKRMLQQDAVCAKTLDGKFCISTLPRYLRPLRASDWKVKLAPGLIVWAETTIENKVMICTNKSGLFNHIQEGDDELARFICDKLGITPQPYGYVMPKE